MYILKNLEISIKAQRFYLYTLIFIIGWLFENSGGFWNIEVKYEE